MKVKELGEFQLIRKLGEVVARESTAPRAKPGSGASLLLGIGDDAAVWQSPPCVQLLTTDTLVENVHFKPGTATPQELGWKALAVNLSDIAAMGGTPEFAVVTLGLPASTEVERLLDMYRGMVEVANLFEVSIVGGDIVASPVFFVTVSLTGTAPVDGGQPRLLTRSSAREGDAIAATGFLGNSAGGLKMLLGSLIFDTETTALLRTTHLKPFPRLREGQALRELGIPCAMDISDGLVSDLTRICEASGLEAEVLLSQVPVHPRLRAAFPREYLKLALSGGEDYELLFTGSPSLVEEAIQRLRCPATVIGTMKKGEPGRVIVLGEDGRPLDLGKPGWDHLRQP